MTNQLPVLPEEIKNRLDRIWRDAYDARTHKELAALYAQWAKTYDQDHEAIGFFGHERAAEVLARYTPYPALAAVLDAGAGTGAVGTALARRAFENITALDLSAEMLEQARRKGIYRNLLQADLGQPLDALPSNHFDAAVLVGVFSYGQAPAHSIDEIVRVVKPGGVVVLTMRTDFHGANAMGVAEHLRGLEQGETWKLVEATAPEPYLPLKDPEARFQVFCYRVLPKPESSVDRDFADAVATALRAPRRVKRIDHCHIWDSMASRLYDSYIECPEYYLNDCEEEILSGQADAIIGDEKLVVELGCGSARKIRHLLTPLVNRHAGGPLDYVPIDLSPGALDNTRRELQQLFSEALAIDPRQGHFREVLPLLPREQAKAMFFFGSSLGNIESLSQTVMFLRGLAETMNKRDRLVVGLDLHKDEAILRRAYEAGPRNLSFFLNMIRRINNELDANLDVHAFKQESTYDADTAHEGIENRCVNLKLVSTRDQHVFVGRLGLEITLRAGEAIQVGTSRKFRRDDIARLAEVSGLRLQRQWVDKRSYFSVNELVPV